MFRVQCFIMSFVLKKFHEYSLNNMSILVNNTSYKLLQEENTVIWINANTKGSI